MYQKISIKNRNSFISFCVNISAIFIQLSCARVRVLRKSCHKVAVLGKHLPQASQLRK